MANLIKHPIHRRVLAFTTTRLGGVSQPPYHTFNLADHVNDNPAHVAQNRQILANELGIATNQLQFAQQTHSANVALVTKLQPAIANTDALITNQKALCLCILTADCVPVLLFDPVNTAIAPFMPDAWTAANICGLTLSKMQHHFSSNPDNIMAVIGPSITATHYQVDQAVLNTFGMQYNANSAVFAPSANRAITALPYRCQPTTTNSRGRAAP
jgi:polyphenol oxidase